MQKTLVQTALFAAGAQAQYTYGNDCQKLTAQDCSLVSDCNRCAWSWPTSDAAKWASDDAKCRCASSDGGSTTDYTYGGACATLTDQDCGKVSGCSTCSWSWPTNDPKEWLSDDAKCRCESSSGGDDTNDGGSTDYTFGNSCANLTDDACGDVSGCNSCNFSWPSNDPAQWDSNDAMCRCKSSSDDGGDDDGNDDNTNRSEYGWGGDCATNNDDACNGCDHCKFSWRLDDPELYEGDTAMCRCQTDDDLPTPYDKDELDFGGACQQLDSQLCADEPNCISCNFSWPKDDPLLWEGPDAMCRCQYKEGDYIPPTYPPLDVKIDGKEEKLWLQMNPDWSAVTTEGSQLDFEYNNRVYLSTQEQLDTSKYFMPNMLGGTLEYDVDLSEVGCGCVTALYTILMPTQAATEDPWKYCDANAVDGHFCPEFDIMEANKFAYRAVGHTCDAPTNGIYQECDRSGQCSVDVHENELTGEYLPGSRNGMDTNKEFHVKVDYKETNGIFTGYSITFTQEGREVVLDSGDCTSYLGEMTEDVQKMVFSISNWSTDQGLDWLEHGQCTGTCDTQNTFTTIKNLHFQTATYNPPPPPDNTVYKYGDSCSSDQDSNLCGEDCLHCQMSWPFEDLMAEASENAACRCLPMQRATNGLTYSETDISASGNSGICDDCGANCRMSWPHDSTEGSQSAEAMYRCKPYETEEVGELSYGPDCINLYDMQCGADCHDCRESWPQNDPKKWYSDQALCRCKTEQIRETIFGDRCAKLDSGLCGTHCRECNMSWEATDTMGAQGSTAACRCKHSW